MWSTENQPFLLKKNQHSLSSVQLSYGICYLDSIFSSLYHALSCVQLSYGICYLDSMSFSLKHSLSCVQLSYGICYLDSMSSYCICVIKYISSLKCFPTNQTLPFRNNEISLASLQSQTITK